MAMKPNTARWEHLEFSPALFSNKEEIHTDGMMLLIIPAQIHSEPLRMAPAKLLAAEDYWRWRSESIDGWKSVDFVELIQSCRPDFEIDVGFAVRCGGKWFDGARLLDLGMTLYGYAGIVHWAMREVPNGHVLYLRGEGWDFALMGVKGDYEAVTVLE